MNEFLHPTSLRNGMNEASQYRPASTEPAGHRPHPSFCTPRARFSRSFDAVFRAEGGKVLVTPVKAPKANAYAERWVQTVRAECLDWLLIVGRGHLEQALRVYVAHYNTHRPHRALALQAPAPDARLAVVADDQPARVHRRDLTRGLLHEYRRAA